MLPQNAGPPSKSSPALLPGERDHKLCLRWSRCKLKSPHNDAHSISRIGEQSICLEGKKCPRPTKQIRPNNFKIQESSCLASNHTTAVRRRRRRHHHHRRQPRREQKSSSIIVQQEVVSPFVSICESHSKPAKNIVVFWNFDLWICLVFVGPLVDPIWSKCWWQFATMLPKASPRPRLMARPGAWPRWRCQSLALHSKPASG